MEKEHCYEDIIGLSRPVSARYPAMTTADRAAQFAPFSALNGFDGVIRETARLTDTPLYLDDGVKAELNGRLLALQARLSEHPRVKVTCFRPDKYKSGGAVIALEGRLKRICPEEQRLVFLDGTAVAMEELYDIQMPDED